MMGRVIFWTLIYLLVLGSIDIEVRYKDGLHIELKGWLNHWKRKREAAARANH